MKREGVGRGNWGTATDEGLEQDTVDAVNPEETTAVVEDEKKPEDAPQPEDKEMTLEEYEKVLEQKQKALLSLKAEERKVEIDKELQAMQQLSVKKDGDEVFIKLVRYVCAYCSFLSFYPCWSQPVLNDCRALTRT
uniref:Hyaluronan/mRNA-binding protein domain-containing protein n=1 Tax=Zea mays TaxID=4577 RepID=A0A804Q241_MAIZE